MNFLVFLNRIKETNQNKWIHTFKYKNVKKYILSVWRSKVEQRHKYIFSAYVPLLESLVLQNIYKSIKIIQVKLNQSRRYHRANFQQKWIFNDFFAEVIIHSQWIWGWEIRICLRMPHIARATLRDLSYDTNECFIIAFSGIIIALRRFIIALRKIWESLHSAHNRNRVHHTITTHIVFLTRLPTYRLRAPFWEQETA